MVTWTGTTSFDWTEPKNWDSGSPPNEDEEMVVPGGSTFAEPVPPAGTKVKALTLSGGGLQARMQATEKFTWEGGSLRAGLDLGTLAQVLITGRGGQALGGDLTTSLNSLVETTINMSGGARLTNGGVLNCSGGNRLTWASGANPFFVNNGLLNLVLGSLTLDDVIGLVKGQLTILPGSEFVVSSFAVPSYLQDAAVAGGGTIRIRAGGLWASSKTTFAAGTTVELDENGRVEAQAAVARHAAVTGPIAGKQGLLVAGRFHWAAGAVEGDVTIDKTGVFVLDGPRPHEHANGTLQIDGSGAVVGPTNIAVAFGRWQVNGGLLLMGPFFLDRGNGWSLGVADKGELRVDAGPGEVRLGNFPLENVGSLVVSAGTLRLDQQPERLTDADTTSLTIALGATVRADLGLSLKGVVTGFGTVAGDLEVLGRLTPGADKAAGALEVTGALTLSSKSTTTLHLESAAKFSKLNVDAQVSLDGRAEVTTSFAPKAGDRLEIVRGGPGTVLAGRFASIKIPKVGAGAPHYRIEYAGPSASLVAASAIPGFHLNHPPTNAKLKKFVDKSPFRWIGFYLHAPCHKKASWNGKLPFLKTLGLGTMIIFVGQQMTDTDGNCSNKTTTPAQGELDADLAVARATAEGFDPGSWIYLDVEKSNTRRIDDAMLGYVRAWVDRMLGFKPYQPGLYVHQSDFAALDAVVTSSFQAAGRSDRARYWIIGGPKVTSNSDPISRCGIPEATTWQRAGNIDQTRGGVTLQVDLDLSVFADPSAP